MKVRDVDFNANKQKETIEEIEQVVASGEDIRDSDDIVFAYLIMADDMQLFNKIIKQYKIKISTLSTRVFASAIAQDKPDFIKALADGKAPFEDIAIEIVATPSREEMLRIILAYPYIAKQMKNSTRGIIPDVLAGLKLKKVGKFAKLLR